MDRETSKRMTARTNRVITEGNATLETPPQVFLKLNHDFGPFDIDLTANEKNHKCDVWLGPGGVEEDALVAVWMQYGQNGYSNPPYGPFVSKILKLAKQRTKFGFSSTFLLPLRVTKTFRNYVLQGAADLLFCDSRICFYENGSPKLNKIVESKNFGQPDVAMFDSIVVNYRPGHVGGPNVDVWEVPKHY